MDVPDGEIDRDTGHCCASGELSAGYAPAASVTWLWAAGIVTGEKDLYWAMHSQPVTAERPGTMPAELEAVLHQRLAGTPWTLAIAYAFDAAAEPARATLIGFVRPENGRGHMVCVVSGPDGVWLHDPNAETRIAVTPAQIAAYHANIVVKLVTRKETA